MPRTPRQQTPKQFITTLTKIRDDLESAHKKTRTKLYKMVATKDLRIEGFKFDLNPYRPGRPVEPRNREQIAQYHRLVQNTSESADRLRQEMIVLRKHKEEADRIIANIERGLSTLDDLKKRSTKTAREFNAECTRFSRLRKSERSFSKWSNVKGHEQMAKKKTTKKTAKKTTTKKTGGRQPEHTIDQLLAMLDHEEDQTEKRKIRARLRAQGYRISDQKKTAKKTAKKSTTKKSTTKKSTTKKSTTKKKTRSPAA